MFAVPSSCLPPLDKPWLISTRGEINHDATEFQKWKKTWSAEHPFPGTNASIDNKLLWMKNMHDCRRMELEDCCFFTDAPDARDVVAEVLMENAPQKLVIEVHVPRILLSALNLNEKQEQQFAVGLPTFGRKGYEGEGRWVHYKNWLLNMDQPAAMNGTDEDYSVAIGSISCNNSDKLVDIVKDFAENFGIDEHYRGLQLVDFEKFHKACCEWGLQKQVGENVYVEEASTKQKSLSENRFFVQVCMTLQNPSSNKSDATEEFGRWLKATEAASVAANDVKTFMLIPRNAAVNGKDSDEEISKPVTVDCFHVLWMPEAQETDYERVRLHFRWGEGEARSIKSRLEKGNTDTGNLKASIFEAELLYIMSIKSLPAKLCAALALTRVASEDTYWIHDNEVPDEVANSIRKLASLWRTNLLKNDDAELGIGLEGLDVPKMPGSKRSKETGDLSDSRKALYKFLELMAPRFENASDYARVKFNWRPPQPRGHKAGSSQKKRRSDGSKRNQEPNLRHIF